MGFLLTHILYMLLFIHINSIFNRVAGGRALIWPEPYREDDYYEYIRGIADYTYYSFTHCCNFNLYT